jgi:hypothetical protein
MTPTPRKLYGETPLESYRKGYEIGYLNGYTEATQGKECDARTPLQRSMDAAHAEMREEEYTK